MNVAFIPVRGGSKSIPMKNIKKMAGKPLVYWTVKAACQCEQIDCVYVSTDSDIISKTVLDFSFNKVHVINRSAACCTDTASTEMAMLEFANEYEFDNIILVQATSPLLTCDDLTKGFEMFLTQGTDSVLSVVRQKRFCWDRNEEGGVRPANYDVFHRPRRQEFDGFLVENGAFYITSKARLLQSKNRISGNIKAYEMDEDSYLEIDEPSDWYIIEELLKRKLALKNVLNIPLIKMFLTDCDGCLTDGGMYYSENGDEIKRFNTLDGMGIRLLRERGIVTGIITGESRTINQRRADKIGVDILRQGIKDKLAEIREICSERDIQLSEVAYLGDDINDLEVIKAVGFGCAPRNGIETVKRAAKYITQKAGGEGAVREVVELILE